MTKGTLYVIPTYLHELAGAESLSLAISHILKSEIHIVAEDIRTARRSISKMNLNIDIAKMAFTKMDKHTLLSDLAHIQQLLLHGKQVGIMSEAGCPGIADPGNILTQWAHKNQISVVPLVGPNSLILTLMASGLNGQNFSFHGYLPIESESRKAKLLEHERISKKSGYAQLYIETPYRNNSLFADMMLALQAETFLCIGVELTSPHGFVQTKQVKFWKHQPPDLHKKNVLFILQSA